MAALHAMQAAQGQAVLHWYDASGEFGRGLAYGACEAFHLLNVRAGKMGATPSDVGGFYQWLSRHEQAAYSAQDFVPRHLFGKYVQHLLDVAVKQSGKLYLRRHASEVERIELCEGGLKVYPQRLSPETVDKVVLATGNEAPAIPSFIGDDVRAHPAFIADPWHTDEGSLLRADAHNFRGHVCIVGTGLTAVDISLSLLRKHPSARVTLVSRRGLLPAEHAKEGPPFSGFPQPLPESLTGWWQIVKQALRVHEAGGGNWREVIDSLRPHTAEVWHRFSEADKRRAQRHCLARWQAARHRMASSVAAELHEHLLRRHMDLIAGHVLPVEMEGEKFRIGVKRQGMEFSFAVDSLIMCTGPNLSLEQSGIALLRQMHEDGLLQSGSLRMGCRVAADGTACGTAPGKILPMGNLLVGEWLECTAVPEVRVQAVRAGQWLAETS